ncbi:MAG: cobyric acid synthase CobQ, partial [Pseudophaeobacter sp.]
DAFRAQYLAGLGHGSHTRYEADVEETLDALADHLEHNMDLNQLLSLSAPIPARS